MESCGQRLYSVLTKTEVREKMMEEIVQISEVFSMSRSDATVALIRLGWNSFRASDVLGDDKEKFLSQLGLVQVSSSDDEMVLTDGDGDNLVSTPFCSHKFCSDCWRDHLSQSLENVDKTVMISCLKQDCVASVGPDTIEKLAEPVKEMYERYVLGSFMDSKSIKWCPALGCEYAIERHDQDSSEDGDDESSDFGVVCLCGHTFCWKCKLESHRPVTCNNASLWLNQLLDEARTLAWIGQKTKPCPHCQRHLKKDYKDQIVTCFCSYVFCWRCLRSEEEHRGIYHCAEVSAHPPRDAAALLGHLKLWEERHEAMEMSKRDLEAIEQKIIPLLTENCCLGETDMRALREASMLIVQCRLVLKWSCVFGYFIIDYHSAKKQYLNHLLEEATANILKHKGTIDELTMGTILGGDIAGFRHKLETSTTATGNYFHFFVKTLEDGLCEVKVDVYEDVATDYWFCDRCTFQNDCFEQKCRMCVVPFESPPRVDLGNNDNSTASALQQQVLDMPSNPFARQGGSNPFATPPLMDFGNNNSAHQQQAPNMSSNPFAREGGTNLFGNKTASAHQQQAPNMSSNPFAGQGGTNLFESAPLMAFGYNNNATASAHQQQVPNMSNNPFARQGGTNHLESRPVAFGNNSVGASAHQQQVPNMANNPFSFPVSPPRVAFGNNSIGASAAHQQEVPNMANNPFARPGGTYPLQSPQLVAFGNNNVSASGLQQQAPNMANDPFARQEGTNPIESGPVGIGNNNDSSASAHQQQVPDVPSNPLARQGGTKLWKFD